MFGYGKTYKVCDTGARDDRSGCAWGKATYHWKWVQAAEEKVTEIEEAIQEASASENVLREFKEQLARATNQNSCL